MNQIFDDADVTHLRPTRSEERDRGSRVSAEKFAATRLVCVKCGSVREYERVEQKCRCGGRLHSWPSDRITAWLWVTKVKTLGLVPHKVKVGAA